MASIPLISWDLGATKCAAALMEYHPKEDSLSCLQHTQILLEDAFSIDDLTHQIEASLGVKMADAAAICIGGAGRYDGECLVSESGYPYRMDFARLAKTNHWPEFSIIHDYAPIVCATFTKYISNPNNARILHPGQNQQFGRRVALGVGTGLGVKDGVLLPNGDFWLGCNEVGHIGLATPPLVNSFYKSRHQELIQFLSSQKNLPITFESILSGKGLLRLHSFLESHHEFESPESLGKAISDGHCEETMKLFSWYLGLFVGTIQCIFMPEGGVWITGGVVLKHLDLFNYDDFFQGIEATPAYWDSRQQFPLGVMQNNQHAFWGGAYYALKRHVKPTVAAPHPHAESHPL